MSTHRIAAGAIVEQDGRFLLVHSVVPGRYDFWVAPGGGVQGSETFEEAAAREVFEETGLVAEIGTLLYIEEFASPECRFVKFWFAARVRTGAIDTTKPEAQAEHILEAQWLSLDELAGKTVFPSVLTERYAQDRAAGFRSVVRLPYRPMVSW